MNCMMELFGDPVEWPADGDGRIGGGLGKDGGGDGEGGGDVGGEGPGKGAIGGGQMVQ